MPFEDDETQDFPDDVPFDMLDDADGELKQPPAKPTPGLDTNATDEEHVIPHTKVGNATDGPSETAQCLEEGGEPTKGIPESGEDSHGRPGDVAGAVSTP
eukprot:scaffold823_cov397-Prasinococcus_capsulatus_cf.AAC.12